MHKDNVIRFGFDKVTANAEVARTVAKGFVFQLLYGGSAYGYTMKPQFNFISEDQDYWQGIIDEFYNKYTRLADWHGELVRIAENTGKLVMPTGREYKFQPYQNRYGDWRWPRTKILNYPVQGLGQDVMAIARVVAFKRLSNNKNILFVNSVHDSIILDLPADLCYNTCLTLEKVFTDIPINFRRQFGVEFNLPMRCEIKYGQDWGNMTKFKEEDFI
jgi:DNA polymerase I-like protein with 3'-5' exonuclease and polymerase domains